VTFRHLSFVLSDRNQSFCGEKISAAERPSGGPAVLAGFGDVRAPRSADLALVTSVGLDVVKSHIPGVWLMGFAPIDSRNVTTPPEFEMKPGASSKALFKIPRHYLKLG
jgi:hypothetical protein